MGSTDQPLCLLFIRLSGRSRLAAVYDGIDAVWGSQHHGRTKLPVAIALIGAGLSRASVVFMGWFGRRGLASIVLGLVYLEQETHLPGEPLIRVAVMSTVLLSIFAHGLSAMLGSIYTQRNIASLGADAPEHANPSIKRDAPDRQGG